MDAKIKEVIKKSGQRTQFSFEKLEISLTYPGADQQTIAKIVSKVGDEFYPGISTKEIYNRAYAMLKVKKAVFASKYKLKKAIYELGPTGFPFEKFIAALLQYSGYRVRVGQILGGQCVTHEVDVLATKNDMTILIECKFHTEEDRNCDFKIPLYIHSRFRDILSKVQETDQKVEYNQMGWVATNTRFTDDATKYGRCAGLYLLSRDPA